MNLNNTLKYIITLMVGLSTALTSHSRSLNAMHMDPGVTVSTDNEDSLKLDTVSATGIVAEKGIAFYQDRLIIYSNSRYQQKMIPGHISFGIEGTYLADPQQLERFPKENLASKEPFAYPPAGMAISPGENTLYYTAPGRNNRKKIFAVPVEKGPSGSQVALAPSYADLLSFCENGDNYQHPAISKSGELMVFASDRKGAMGGFDLFMVQKSGNQWERPVHLGNEINSVQDELYPFIDHDNNLYLSSEGHSGFGGLDIYMCKYTGEGWERPINLMQPINSEKDEYGIKMDQESQTAFYTSHNESGRDGSGEASWQLIHLISDGPGTLPAELHARAMHAFEEMFGVAFSSTAAQQVKIPEPIKPAELLSAQESEQSTGERPAETSASEREMRENATEETGQAMTEASAAEQKEATGAGTEEAAKAEQEKPEAEEQLVEATEEAPPKQETAPTPVAEQRAKEAQPEASKEEVTVDPDAPVFRIQITSTRNSVAGKKVTVAGKTYTVFEYLYKGAYRQTVGAFRDLDDAKAFQSKCRNAGYNQAFVAAFINDERVTDPAVFRR